MRTLTSFVASLAYVLLATSCCGQSPVRKTGVAVVPDTFRTSNGTLYIVAGDTVTIVGKHPQKPDTTMSVRYIMTDTSLYMILPTGKSQKVPSVMEQSLRAVVKSYVEERKRNGGRP